MIDQNKINVSVRGKVRQTVSVQMEDIIPVIIEAVKKELCLSEDIELHYTSNTRFITFNIIFNKEQKKGCNCEACEWLKMK